MGRFISAGGHGERIVDFHSKKGMQLPPLSQFLPFFKEFGQVLEVFPYVNPKKEAVSHTYVVFETLDAVKKVKQRWSSKAFPSSWRDCCHMVAGISNAPRELVERLNLQPSASFRAKDVPPAAHHHQSDDLTSPDDVEDKQTNEKSSPVEESLAVHPKFSKRKRVSPAPEDSQNKKQRSFEEPELGENTSSAELPGYTPLPPSNSDTESPLIQIKKEHRTPRLSPTPPALAYAKQAVILAAKERKKSLQNKAASDVISELSRLKAERDEARAERDAFKIELEKTTVQRDNALELVLVAQRELEELKAAVDDRDERTNEVLSLVTASLHSLQRMPRRAEA